LPALQKARAINHDPRLSDNDHINIEKFLDIVRKATYAGGDLNNSLNVAMEPRNESVREEHGPNSESGKPESEDQKASRLRIWWFKQTQSRLAKVIVTLIAITAFEGQSFYKLKDVYTGLSQSADSADVLRIIDEAVSPRLADATKMDFVFALSFCVLVQLFVWQRPTNGVTPRKWLQRSFAGIAALALLIDVFENVAILEVIDSRSPWWAECVAEVQGAKFTLYFLAFGGFFVGTCERLIQDRAKGTGAKSPGQVAETLVRQAKLTGERTLFAIAADSAAIVKTLMPVLVPLILFGGLMQMGQFRDALLSLPTVGLKQGSTLALLFAFSIVTWFWSRILIDRLLHDWKSNPTICPLRNWTLSNGPAVVAILPLLIFARTCWTVWFSGKTESTILDFHNAGLFVIFVWAISLAIVLLVWHLIGRLFLLKKRPKKSEWITLAEGIPNKIGQVVAWSMVGVALVLAGWFLFRPYQIGALTGPVATVVIGATFWTNILSSLRLLSHQLDLPLFKIAVAGSLLLSYFNLRDNRRVRLVRRPLNASKTLQEHFTKWLNERIGDEGDKKPPYPVFVVCMEGGGMRAGYVAAATMAAIQARNPEFYDHVYAVSSVSGGSLGSAVIASLDRAKVECRKWPDMVDSLLKADLLSPIAGQFLLLDAPYKLSPLPMRFQALDRSKALSRSLEDAWSASGISGDNPLNLPLSKIADEPNLRKGPALLFNTTTVDGGLRMVLGPVRLPEASNGGLHCFATRAGDQDIKMSDAASLSARFPGITTSGEIPVWPRLRLIDGGLADNSGVATGIDMVRELATIADVRVTNSKSNSQKIRIVLITIGGTPGAAKADRTTEPAFNEAIAYIQSGVGLLLSSNAVPPQTANASLAGLRLRSTRSEKVDIYARRLPFELEDPDKKVPLAWVLSKTARDEVRKQVGGAWTDGTCREFDDPSTKGNRAALQGVMDLLAGVTPEEGEKKRNFDNATTTAKTLSHR
jgi:hypothetical protein